MRPQTLDALLGVELPVTIRLGSALVTFGEVMAFNAGSAVEFDRAPEGPVEVLVNGRVMARGEMVLAQGSYGVRITEISNSRERLDTGSGPEPKTAGGL